jgi:helicase
VPYTVAEYKNMVGRAGRLGYSKRGESYVISSRGLDEHRVWAGYVLGKPEDIKSVFLSQTTDPRTQMLRTLAALEPGADGSVDAHLLVSFLESTFGVFQKRQLNPAWTWRHDNILAMLRELVGHQLIEMVGDGRYRLTDLGRFAGEGGVFVDSIIRLVEVLRPLTAAPNSSTLIAAAQVTRELDEVYLPFNRKGKNTEHRRWPMELAHQQVAPNVWSRIGIGGTDHLTRVARTKKAMASLLYASKTPLSMIERHLMQHQLGDGAAGAVRATADRTRDLVPAVVRVFEFLHPDIAVGDVAERTMVRLELGIPTEMAELGTILGAVLSRAQYLSLLEQSIITPDQFVSAKTLALVDCLRVTENRVLDLQEAVQEDKRQREEILVPLLPPPTE